jgi:hypothetical protein
VELELNLLIHRWSWSGVKFPRSGVGVELKLNLLIHRWSWSGVKITRSGVGEELDLMHFVNSNSTPFDVVTCPEK